MRFAALASRNLKETVREPLSVVFEIGLPLIFMLMFWALGKNLGEDMFTATMQLPAVVIFGFSFLMSISAITLARDRQSALFLRLLTTPLKSGDFIAAYSLPYVLIAIFQIAVCFAMAALLGLEIIGNIGIVFLIFILMAVCLIGLGMFIGSIFTENQANIAGSAVIVFVAVLGGCWMPLKFVGGVFESIGYALPFAHAIDAARNVLNGSTLGDVSIDLLWVIGYTVAFFILGAVCLGWKTKE
ncbi:MAG: ABC transporter permease [Candidatus Humimicrobiaceae bacterium]|jgi:ABC-2 type transport system permease protein|nr:ABC transporter permease [Candidatus Humimicrobiaceae bacterium]